MPNVDGTPVAVAMPDDVNTEQAKPRLITSCCRSSGVVTLQYASLAPVRSSPTPAFPAPGRLSPTLSDASEPLFAAEQDSQLASVSVRQLSGTLLCSNSKIVGAQVEPKGSYQIKYGSDAARSAIEQKGSPVSSLPKYVPVSSYRSGCDADLGKVPAEATKQLASNMELVTKPAADVDHGNQGMPCFNPTLLDAPPSIGLSASCPPPTPISDVCFQQPYSVGLQVASVLPSQADVAGHGDKPDDCDSDSSGSVEDLPEDLPLSEEQLALEIIEAARLDVKNVWKHAKMNRTSSVAVQMALNIAAAQGETSGQWDNARALVSGMLGRVRQACESPFGNHVISRIFEVMPTSLVQCLAEEMHGFAVFAARHRFGCRCVVRLIRHHGMKGNDEVFAVIQVLVEEVSCLTAHQFGKHVVEELLELDVDVLPTEQRQVVTIGMMQGEAKLKVTKCMLKMALKTCDADDMQRLVGENTTPHDMIPSLTDRVVKRHFNGQHDHGVSNQISCYALKSGFSRPGTLSWYLYSQIALAPTKKKHSRRHDTTHS